MLFVLLSVTAIIGIIISKIIDFNFNIKEKKFSSRHPKYIEFANKYNKLQREQMDIWNSTMPDCIKEVDYCLEKMKYYPKYSENYQYYEARADVARMKIDRCKEEYDKKECEIFQLVKENKGVIDGIKDERPKLYDSWVTEYKELR